MQILPDKTSELLEVALRDLEACEADPKYRVAMHTWHHYLTPEDVCLVCLAGAVMAKSLDVAYNHTRNPTFVGDEATRRKLFLLENLRDPSCSLNRDAVTIFSQFRCPTYQHENFKPYLRALIEYYRGRGD
jgi:hypothetical protein